MGKRKIRKLVPVVEAILGDKMANITKDTLEFIQGDDSFIQTVTDIANDIADDAVDNRERQNKKEKHRIGYNLVDLDKLTEKRRLKQVKKISKKFQDAVVSDANGPMLVMDNSQNEFRLYATMRANGWNSKKYWWVGNVINSLTRDESNVYTITTDIMTIIYDRNSDDILEVRNF